MAERFSAAARAAAASVVLGLLAACSGPEARLAKPAPKNATYRQASVPVEARVEDLLGRMTLDEKIGQMAQIEKGSIGPGDVAKYFLGSVLSGGGGRPTENSAAAWYEMVAKFQKEALATRLGIPILYGVDAVHGHNNVEGATVFPHNIGLGAARDPDLVEAIGRAVAVETLATGIPWNFAPCVAVVNDPRWGRFYESFGSDPALVAELGVAFLKGYQAGGGALKPIATVKHFLGDGQTVWGSSTTGGYKIDQGDTVGDDAFLRAVLLPPYAAAVASGARAVMPSFSSWNGVKMHAQKALITDLLKGELGFSGFVVSDWGGIDQVAKDYDQAVAIGINAGIDMNMVPYDAKKFIASLRKAVESGAVPQARIDDAVRRILRVKFEMGLFETPIPPAAEPTKLRLPETLALARRAVAESVVLLKNDGVLPLAKGTKVYVAGAAADDIGVQCGGWTIDWQGKAGDITAGTTILGGIRELVGAGEVVYDKFGRFASGDPAGVCVVVVGETPYAEGAGDNSEIALKPNDLKLVERVAGSFGKVVLVLLSGRPLVLGAAADTADAIAAAWLPGTEGGGVADVLYGAVATSGKLGFAWPVSVDQLPLANFASGAQKPLYPYGYGLGY
jgi:beta-glucosidase